MYKEYKGISDPQALLSKREFPFYYFQLAKSPNLKSVMHGLYFIAGKVVACIVWEENGQSDLFQVNHTHLIDLEVVVSARGQGHFKRLMSNFISKHKNIVLQANNERLICTYEKLGFKAFGDPKETGNLMINFVRGRLRCNNIRG